LVRNVIPAFLYVFNQRQIKECLSLVLTACLETQEDLSKMAEAVSQDILQRTGEAYRPGTAREVSRYQFRKLIENKKHLRVTRKQETKTYRID
jgi:hypothetical protein